MFLRQRGKALYTADGQLAFDVGDLVDFWNYLDSRCRTTA